MIDVHDDNYIFNSALETGIRSVCILAVDHSARYDLQQLLAFDHLVVHTGDIENAPVSLHPNVTQRNGELLVRRPLVERGLNLMESKGLVNKSVAKNGFFYNATELAVVFIESLTNSYTLELNNRAQWAVEKYKNSGNKFFIEIFNTAFDRWSNEFQVAEISIGHQK
ncbi:MAG: threonine transporter [Gammaproteobacteria bacterium]|nr:threonine transporter [Gammaproteobacteria bacterium]